MAEELKSCPFCGGTGRHVDRVGLGGYITIEHAEDCEIAVAGLFIYDSNPRRTERIAAWNRRSSQPIAGTALVVRPLEWHQTSSDEWTSWPHLPGPGFTVFSEGDPVFVYERREFNTLDEAKAAAQYDYETRIKSALIETPALCVCEADRNALAEAED